MKQRKKLLLKEFSKKQKHLNLVEKICYER